MIGYVVASLGWSVVWLLVGVCVGFVLRQFWEGVR